MAVIEIVMLTKGATMYARCLGAKSRGAWHCLQIVRQREFKFKRRYFFCPRCCAAGSMLYFTGFGRRDIACNHCVDLPSINTVINSTAAVQTRSAIALKDYDSLGKILKKGHSGLIGYRLAMDMMSNQHKYVPDLRTNDKRHRDILKKHRYENRLQCQQRGRLLYVNKKLIVR